MSNYITALEKLLDLIKENLLIVGIVAAVYVAVSTFGMWKLFRKAGKRPWMALIPFARDYTLTEVSSSGLIGAFAYVILPLLGLFNLYAIRHFYYLNNGESKPIYMILLVIGLVCLTIALFLHVLSSVKLANVFAKGPVFLIGLILLLPIFLLLLGLGRSKYVRSNFTSMGLKASRTISNTLIYTVLVVMSIIWLIPFVLIVLQSFRVEKTGLCNYMVPKTWGLDNYKNLFNTDYPKWYLNTFIMAVVVSLVQTIIVLCMSYTLSRFRFKLRKGLMQFMLILGMFPGMLTMIILYRVLSDLGLTDAHAVPGLILVYVASSGMGYYVSKGFFDTIPKSLDEAARVDGATRAQVLRKIILPLSKPIVIYTVLTAFMAPWADFVFASYIAHGKSIGMNVAVGLNSWLDKDSIEKCYTMFCAGGVLVAIPVAALFMCLQRYYVEGVTGGAVKG